jgi:prolyl 4-hydroxylase
VNVLINTAYYMKNIVMNTENKLYHSVRNGACKNEDEMCAVWAAEGKCDKESENYEWMVMHCGPVCQTCELMDFQIRCPIPEGAVDALSRSGGDNGLHALFERIAGERNLTQEQIGGGMENLDYSVEVFSRPGGSKTDSASNVIDGPWVVALDNFLSAEECEKLIQLGQIRGYEKSRETTTLSNGNRAEDEVTDTRTSTNAWCDDAPLKNSSTSCRKDPVMKEVWNRIALVTGVPVDNSEDLQLLYYTPGQFYKVHHDYIAAHTYGSSGPRVLTFFLYLNDVEEGGGTNFPELAPGAAPLTVQPKRGKALLWPSVLDEDVNKKDERTEHEALNVEKGVKYGANAWLHLRDEQHLKDALECG